jgi:hypothetical protein
MRRSVRSKVNVELFSFSLTGINQQMAIEGYIKGEHLIFEDSPNKKSVQVFGDIKKNAVELTEDPMQKVFTINSNSNKQVIHTTNNNVFQFVDANNMEMSKIKFNCRYCRVEFEMVPIGFPLILEFDGKKYTAHCDEPYHCSFECGFARIDEVFKLGSDDYKNVEENFKLIFSLMHPGKELVRAKDFRLHEINGGSLTEEQYRSNSHRYFKIPSLITLPVKRMYAAHKN